MGTPIMSSHSHSLLLLRPAPVSLSSFISKPSAACSSFLQLNPNTPILLSSSQSSPHHFRPFTASSAFVSFSRSISDLSEVLFDDEIEDEDEDAINYEDEDEIEDLELENIVVDGLRTVVASELSLSAVNKSESNSTPSLTVKEKKELASYARSLGKKLKSQLVGKSGVTPGLATSFIETLEANELLKIKVLGNCPEEMEDVVRQLEESTGSVVVNQIGRTVLIYRPSITKMKAEEEKRRVRKTYARKEPDRLKSILQNKIQTTRSSNRGRRGSSRSGFDLK